MPFMDGYQASRQMRELLVNSEEYLRIIAITGHVEAVYVAKALDHGINKVFSKPMPILELGALLQELGYIQEIPSRLL